MLEVGSHSVAHMLDLVGPARGPRGAGDEPLDLPGGARFFRRWRVEAGPGAVGVTLELLLRAGVLRAHDPRPRQPGRRHGRLRAQHLPPAPPHPGRAGFRPVSHDGLRGEGPRAPGPGHARPGDPIRSFDAVRGRPLRAEHRPGDAVVLRGIAGPSSIDRRLSPELGRDVVRTCVEIGRQRPAPGGLAGVWYQWHDGPSPTARPPRRIGSAPRDPGPGRHRIHRPGAGPAAPGPGTSGPGAGPQPRPAARGPEGPAGRDRRGGPVPGRRARPALEGIRCVYHLARPNVKTWEEYAEHEIEATRRVAEACLTAKVGRLIYTGTIDSYYAGAKAGTITEETPLDPHIGWRNYYARAKALSEQALMDLHREKGCRSSSSGPAS